MLDILLFLPLAGFLACLILGNGRSIALAVTLIVFALSLTLAGPVAANPTAFSFATDLPWIETPRIHYHIGVDGLSLWLIVLTGLLGVIAVLAAWNRPETAKQPNLFFGLLLLLQFGILGVFVSLDLFLYYVFWEIALVPALFLISMWGGNAPAAIKFFLYTMAGSVVMLAGILYLYTKTGTFDLPGIQAAMGQIPAAALMPLFLAFFAAFAIKVPLFPLHTWLPDAYTAAPTPITILLAGLMSKMGTYSLIRFGVTLFPAQAKEASSWICALAIIGIVYGAIVAIGQPNLKRLAAYSSVSHLGFVVLGIFSLNAYGLDGAVYQMVNHGVSTGALFLMIGLLEERRQSLEIADFGGVAKLAPYLSVAFAATMLASAGLPTLGNFVGEFLILQGAAAAYFPWAVAAALGVILSACYLLWMYQRVFFGETPSSLRIQDLDAREWAATLPLLVLMIWMGVSATGFLAPIGAKNQTLVAPAAPKPIAAQVNAAQVNAGEVSR